MRILLNLCDLRNLWLKRGRTADVYGLRYSIIVNDIVKKRAGRGRCKIQYLITNAGRQMTGYVLDGSA